MSQKYSGDITIVPDIGYSDFLKVLSNPTPEYAMDCLYRGERATWPSKLLLYTSWYTLTHQKQLENRTIRDQEPLANRALHWSDPVSLASFETERATKQETVDCQQQFAHKALQRQTNAGNTLHIAAQCAQYVHVSYRWKRRDDASQTHRNDRFLDRHPPQYTRTIHCSILSKYAYDCCLVWSDTAYTWCQEA